MITREIKIGSLKLGGTNPVCVEGMVKGKLNNLRGLFSEAEELVSCGAGIVRSAVPTSEDAIKVYNALKSLKVPLVADCHFQLQIVLSAIKAGFDGIRVNPGNMSEKVIMEAVRIAKDNGTALRLGFNSGSCDARSGLDLANLALKWDEKVRKSGFENFLVSMKSPDVQDVVDANRFFSLHSDTPLHIGVTATGPVFEGIIKSSAALGSLLCDGIGDTIRVSLTGSSNEEVRVARILVNITSGGGQRLELITCPTCSRSRLDVVGILKKLSDVLTEDDYKKPVKVAVMGCEVTGPGEASQCDIGVCGTKKGALFIKKGEKLSSLSPEKIIERLVKELRKL